MAEAEENLERLAMLVHTELDPASDNFPTRVVQIALYSVVGNQALLVENGMARQELEKWLKSDKSEPCWTILHQNPLYRVLYQRKYNEQSFPTALPHTSEALRGKHMAVVKEVLGVADELMGWDVPIELATGLLAPTEPQQSSAPAAPVQNVINIATGSAPEAISSTANASIPPTANPEAAESHAFLGRPISQWVQQQAFPPIRKARGDILAACRTPDQLILGMRAPAGYEYPKINWEDDEKRICLSFRELTYANHARFEQVKKYDIGKIAPISVSEDPIVIFWPAAPFQDVTVPVKVIPILGGGPNALWSLLIRLGPRHQH